MLTTYLYNISKDVAFFEYILVNLLHVGAKSFTHDKQDAHTVGLPPGLGPSFSNDITFGAAIAIDARVDYDKEKQRRSIHGQGLGKKRGRRGAKVCILYGVTEIYNITSVT